MDGHLDCSYLLAIVHSADINLDVQISVKYVYTMEFYAAERKKELIPFATAWVDLESIMLSEISQMVRDKYHMISPLTGSTYFQFFRVYTQKWDC